MNHFRITTLLFAFIASFSSIGARDCEFNGRIYKPDSQLPGSCVRLNCNETTGEWDYVDGIFNPDHCCYPCTVRDDPHQFTFDECHYQNHLACEFSLTQTGTSMHPFTGIFNTYVDCGSPFPNRTCLGELTFRAFPKCEIKFDASMWDSKQVLVVDTGATKTLSTAPAVICTAQFGHQSRYVRSVLGWFDPSDNCLMVMGHRGLLARFCVLNNRRPSLHYLEIWTPQIYDDDLFGLCNKFLSLDGMLVTRDETEVACGNHPGDFIHSWAVDPNCPATSRALKKMDNKCPDKIHQEMTKRCEKGLRDVPLAEKKKRIQTGFCAADVCAMKRGNTPDHEIDEYIKTTRATLMKFAINPLERKPKDKFHGKCYMHSELGEKQIVECKKMWDKQDPMNDPRYPHKGQGQ